MHQVISESILDVNSNIIQKVTAKQHDYNTRFIRVKFIDKGDEIELKAEYTYFFTVKRKDGSIKNFSCIFDLDGNSLLLPLNYWSLEYKGYSDAEVSIVDTNAKLTSAIFQIHNLGKRYHLN